MENADSLADPDLQRVIARYGITHVYLGARDGKLTPQKLLQAGSEGASSGLGARPVYSNGAVWIFELTRK